LSFKILMECAAKQKDSNIILALDLISDRRSVLLSKSIELLKKIQPYICAVKMNHHLVLPLGLFDCVKKILKTARDFELPTIMDCKINDIGSTNRVIAENYYKAGFDAVIANPFVGWEEGLEPVFKVARERDRGVLLLTYMSHKGAAEGYGQTVIDPETGKHTQQYRLFAKKALSWKADGAVVGATVSEKIREVHEVLGDAVPIYSPGVGAQGGTVKAARESGARYLIVGRDITQAQNPAEAARKLVAQARM
jgi:orotidine-5'-phosphate decarboxylase